MDLLKKTQEICEYYNIKPARSRGQNFLIRENIYDKIVEIADLNKDDVVLEVGPGLGFLTERLAKKAKKVIAVELDDKLVNILEERMKEQEIENVEVVNEDILKIIFNFQFSIFKQFSISNFQLFKKYKVVANLPYNITAKFLRLILSRPDKPESMTLMLQKEVAERIVAGPGKMSKLAVSVQFYASAKIIDYVGKENFWPEPKVDSAIIKITPLPHPGPLLPFGLTQ
ncbi:ribosomal RNA small subunit methyltransferase A, partial [Candidatus Parcubacteria bacterium]|nr:ribosomal RNA small subunit methyltransferase A [Candidatus Parcubacteria bacterium]